MFDASNLRATLIAATNEPQATDLALERFKSGATLRAAIIQSYRIKNIDKALAALRMTRHTQSERWIRS